MATGFLAIGTKSMTERNSRQFALDLADEQIDTMSQAVLGLTVACARCHDHKFDPIPQRDYYSLAGIFLSTETRYGTASGIQNRHGSGMIELPTGADLPTVGKPLTRYFCASVLPSRSALSFTATNWPLNRMTAGSV